MLLINFHKYRETKKNNTKKTTTPHTQIVMMIGNRQRSILHVTKHASSAVVHSSFRRFHTRCSTLRGNSSNMGDNEGEERRRRMSGQPEGFEDFIRRMGALQERLNIDMPMTFNTRDHSSSRMDMIKMFPFFDFQKRLYCSLYDKEFNEQEFLEGAKQAFLVVRSLIVAQDLDRLSNMVSEHCYDRLEAFYKMLSTQPSGANISIEGEVDRINGAAIHNIQIRETPLPEGKGSRIDTTIAVKYHIKEKLAFIKDEEVLLGSREVKDRMSLWVFERLGLDGQWKISSFVR